MVVVVTVLLGDTASTTAVYTSVVCDACTCPTPRDRPPFSPWDEINFQLWNAKLSAELAVG